MRDCYRQVCSEIKAMISFAVGYLKQLICAFVFFAFAKSRFSHDAAQIKMPPSVGFFSHASSSHSMMLLSEHKGQGRVAHLSIHC